MHAILTPILKLVHTYPHHGRGMTFYKTHLSHALQLPPSDATVEEGLQLRRCEIVSQDLTATKVG